MRARTRSPPPRWTPIPPVLPLFFAFRIMVALGFYFIALFGAMFVLASRRKLERYRWLLRVCLWSLPLPWIAAELGWVVAEVGRQPWTIDGVLPTFLSVSSVPAAMSGSPSPASCCSIRCWRSSRCS